MPDTTLKGNIEIEGIKEAQEKVNRLVEVLKEANALIDSLKETKLDVVVKL